MSEVDSLLPKVDLYWLSDRARKEITDLVALAVTQALAELRSKLTGVPPAALKASDITWGSASRPSTICSRPTRISMAPASTWVPPAYGQSASSTYSLSRSRATSCPSW